MKGRLLSFVVVAALLLTGLAIPRTAHAGSAFCHIVKPGEYLSQIAWRYGVTVSAIVKANNLWNPNLIYPGQCLVIPSAKPPSKCTVRHVVKRGEYLKNPNLIYPGQRLKIPVPCKPKPTPKPKPKPTPKPWKGQYWDNRYLSGDPDLIRYATSVNFHWGLGGPGGGIAQDDFSARFTRTRNFEAGQYRFHIKVDDGVRFWVDNVLLIDEWHDTGVVEYTTEKQLSSGNHRLQIDYYEHIGGARIKFWIEPLDGDKVWKGEFFNNTSLSGEPAAIHYYSAVDFDWGKKVPVGGVTADYFSARWTGEFEFVGGAYRFTATTDDGMRVYLDDTLILDEWHLNPIRTYTVDVDVSAGTHWVKVEYYESKGLAVAKLSWTQR